MSNKSEIEEPAEALINHHNEIIKEARNRSEIDVDNLQCYVDRETDEYFFTTADEYYHHIKLSKTFLKDNLEKHDYDKVMDLSITGYFHFNQSEPSFITYDADETPLINVHIPPTYLHSPAIPPTKDMPALYDGYFSALFPHNKAKEYVLDWITAGFTHKLNNYLMLIGPEGIGKGVLFDILSLLHGQNQSVKMNGKNLVSQFNAQMANKSLIAFDEVKIDKENEEPIKELVNRRIQLSKKGIDQKEIQFTANIVLMSNEYSQGFGESSRRFAVPELTDDKMTDWSIVKNNYKGIADYINELKKPVNISELFWYLHGRPFDLSNLDEAYMDKKFKEIIEAGLNKWQELVRDTVIKRKSCTVPELREIVLERFPKYGNISKVRIIEF